jgi:ribonuclease HI
MELTAVYQLLHSVPEPLLIQSDSQYVIKAFTEWLPGWRQRGMRTSGNKPVENQDLIEAVDQLLTTADVEWEWVRGHVGHPLNERADALARFGAERARRVLAGDDAGPTAGDPPRLSDWGQRGTT